jgi:hypothetical protein
MGQIASVSLSNYRAYCGGFVPPITTSSTELSTKQNSSNYKTKLPSKVNKDILISHDRTTYTWFPQI